jgi:hypothetical protein
MIRTERIPSSIQARIQAIKLEVSKTKEQDRNYSGNSANEVLWDNSGPFSDFSNFNDFSNNVPSL